MASIGYQSIGKHSMLVIAFKILSGLNKNWYYNSVRKLEILLKFVIH